jgi:Flp pilus assembly protein TadG
MRPHKRADEGQGLVEFALVFPILVLVLLFLFDFGRAVFAYTTLDNAARAGIRVAIVDQSNASSCLPTTRTYKCAAAEQTAGLGLAAGTISDATISGSGCTGSSYNIGCDVTLQLTYSFSPITPVVGSLVGPITVTTSATMKIERAYVSP